MKERVCLEALWPWQPDRLTGRVVVSAPLVASKREDESGGDETVIPKVSPEISMKSLGGGTNLCTLTPCCPVAHTQPVLPFEE